MIYLNDHIDNLSLPEALQQLSQQRREVVENIKHETGKRLSAAAYLLLCEGLRAEYGIDEPPVFGYESNGKPFLLHHRDIHFSLSHCRMAAICAIDTKPVGIDIERIRPYKDSLARYTMNQQELDQIAGANNPATEFIRLWTMKESQLKLTGDGIRQSMQHVLRTDRYRFNTRVCQEKGYIYTLCEKL